MKKQFVISALFIFAFAFSAWAQNDYQKPMNQVVRDKSIHRDVMIGPCNRMGLKTNSLFASAFNYEYQHYTPNTQIVNQLKKNINKTRITIVFGSWCGDSRMQVGRFYKILDEAGYKQKYMKVFAVNRELKAPGTKVSSLKIRRIPTFIIYHKGKEIGRIVERPKVSLEADLEKILNKIH